MWQKSIHIFIFLVGDPPCIDKGPDNPNITTENSRVKIGTPINFYDGYSVNIDCVTISGMPPITITWLRNGVFLAKDVNTTTITDAKDGDVVTYRAVNNIRFD